MTAPVDPRTGWDLPAPGAMRARRALPLSEQEITTIAETQRRIEPADAGPPTRGMTQAAQMVVDLRVRN